jgi:hypothetical protein
MNQNAAFDASIPVLTEIVTDPAAAAEQGPPRRRLRMQSS